MPLIQKYLQVLYKQMTTTIATDRYNSQFERREHHISHWKCQQGFYQFDVVPIVGTRKRWVWKKHQPKSFDELSCFARRSAFWLCPWFSHAKSLSSWLRVSHFEQKLFHNKFIMKITNNRGVTFRQVASQQSGLPRVAPCDSPCNVSMLLCAFLSFILHLLKLTVLK